MAFGLSCLYICTRAIAGYAAPNFDCTPTQMLTQRGLKEIIVVLVVGPVGKCVHFASRVLNALDATTNPTVLWAIAKPIRPY